MSPTAALAAFSSAASSAKKRLFQLNQYPVDAETPLDLLGSYITPNDLFYARSHWRPSFPDPALWTLQVDGEVSRPLRLSLDELKRMPRSSATCVLMCSGNGRGLFKPPVPGVQWHWGAVGNACWTGVRVRDLLEKAGLKSSAKYIYTFGADAPPANVPPFHRSVELPKLLDDGIVAYEMNGAPIPELHGSPARLIVPGWAGEHWTKWLTHLSARSKPQTGFYMDTAYRFPLHPGAPGQAVPPNQMKPITELVVKSCITSFPKRAKAGLPVMIRGFAFSGAPDISKVEISDDGGTTWNKATLGTEHDPYAWRLWSFEWTPKAPGAHTLMARAQDIRGRVQPREGVWNPGGYLYNGWHAVNIEVAS